MTDAPRHSETAFETVVEHLLVGNDAAQLQVVAELVDVVGDFASGF